MAFLHIDQLVYRATACGDDVDHGKPEPRIVGVMCLAGSEAVMIGDTPYDAEAVFKASSAGPGVLSGGFTEDALRGAGCFAIAGEISRAWRA